MKINSDEKLALEFFELEDNFSKKKNVKYIPVYASFCLKDL